MLFVVTIILVALAIVLYRKRKYELLGYILCALLFSSVSLGGMVSAIREVDKYEAGYNEVLSQNARFLENELGEAKTDVAKNALSQELQRYNDEIARMERLKRRMSAYKFLTSFNLWEDVL